jgi:hypothetical protein
MALIGGFTVSLDVGIILKFDMPEAAEINRQRVCPELWLTLDNPLFV